MLESFINNLQTHEDEVVTQSKLTTKFAWICCITESELLQTHSTAEVSEMGRVIRCALLIKKTV